MLHLLLVVHPSPFLASLSFTFFPDHFSLRLLNLHEVWCEANGEGPSQNVSSPGLSCSLLFIIIMQYPRLEA